MFRIFGRLAIEYLDPLTGIEMVARSVFDSLVFEKCNVAFRTMAGTAAFRLEKRPHENAVYQDGEKRGNIHKRNAF